MSHKRVIRILSYEGNDDWVAMMLRQYGTPGRAKTIYAKGGTMRELHRFDLADDEMLDGLDRLAKVKVKR